MSVLMTEIFIPSDKLKKTMTDSGEINVLGHLWPFEDDVLRRYWGIYYESKTEFNQFSTSAGILNRYFKVRDKQLVDSLVRPDNPNFFIKREMLWAWLEDNEADMHLPFKSKDGRDGIPFEKAMPNYANLTIDSVKQALRKEDKL